jgi:enamine deaminase RidA (YjgF/YER057c/UK114 family)
MNLIEELKEIGMEIVDDLDILHDNGDTLTCIIRTDLYNLYKEKANAINDAYKLSSK